MKQIAKLLLLGAASLGMFACSDDISGGGEPTPDSGSDKIYVRFQVKPGTRSQTTNPNGGSTGGTEQGSAAESDINSVMIVAVDQYDNYIAHTTSATFTGDPAKGHYTVAFGSENLLEHAGEPISLYIFCNFPSGTVITPASTGPFDINQTPDLGANNWRANNFCMSNADMDGIIQALPRAEVLETYSDASNPLDLGYIDVERLCSRFDLKFADNNEYIVSEPSTVDASGQEVKGEPMVKVTLTHMVQFNEGNRFYIMRRVSDDGTNNKENNGVSNNWELFGAEKGPVNGNYSNCNYVVSAAWQAKQSWDSSKGANLGYINHMTTPGYLPDAGWVSLTDGLSSANSDGYRMWRYFAPNTIPAQVDRQKKGLAMGIIFRGELSPLDNATDDVKARFDGTSDIFAYDGVLYGRWADIKEMVAPESGQPTAPDALIAAYQQVMSEVGESTTPAQFKLAAKKAHFTVYSPDGGKYYTYYYYWNRHNDNEDPNVMVPMEFSVVRNNIYRINVSGISHLGHPSDVNGDPEPEDPDQPIEDGKIYLRVTVKVLDWSVRENNAIL